MQEMEFLTQQRDCSITNILLNMLNQTSVETIMVMLKKYFIAP